MLTVKVARRNKGKVKQIILDVVDKQHGKEIEAGLVDAADYLLKESLELVPKDTGSLAKSARVRTEGSGWRALVFVGYGPFDFASLQVHSPKEGKVVDRYPYLYARAVHNNGFQGTQSLPGVSGVQLGIIFGKMKDTAPFSGHDSAYGSASYASEAFGHGPLSRAQYDRAVSHFGLALGGQMPESAREKVVAVLDVGLPATTSSGVGYLEGPALTRRREMAERFRARIKQK